MWSSRGQLSDWAFLFHHWKPETKVTHSSVVYLDYSHAGHVYILVDHEHHVMVWFLLLTIAGNVYEISAILSLDDETCDNFLDLLEGKFNVPWKETTSRSPLWYDFGEIATKFSLKWAKVCYDGKPVFRTSAVARHIVAKAFRETKG